ncbi:MAG: hypothetical protein M0Q02_04485 [Candidatus Muirbacterium halophilum]|nr:hypothetical protein [Candidatus Muirbacterium halophilum]
MKKIFFISFMLIIILNTLSLSKNDFQFNLNEEVLTNVLSNYMEGSKVSDPEVIFKTDSFEFNAVGHLFVFSAKISFRGNIKVVSDNKIHVNVLNYYQSGKKQSKKTAVEKINDIVTIINNAVDDKKIKITSKYIPSTEYAGILELDLTNYPIIPALSELKIKKITLNNKYISIASTKEMAPLNEAQIQAYIGENLINNIISIFTTPTNRAIKKIAAINFDIETDKISSTVFAKDQNNKTLWINLNYYIKMLEDNYVNFIIKNTSMEDDTFEHTDVIQEIIDLINENIAVYKSPVLGEKMKFVYTKPDNINFRINFDDIIPLPLYLNILGINSFDDYIGIFADSIIPAN